MGVIATVGIQKYSNFSDNAIKSQFLRAARELNVRESLRYFDARIEATYKDDATLFPSIDYNLGAAQWSGSGPTRAGGELRIQGIAQNLTRLESTKKKPAEWTF